MPKANNNHSVKDAFSQTSDGESTSKYPNSVFDEYMPKLYEYRCTNESLLSSGRLPNEEGINRMVDFFLFLSFVKLSELF